ncbi:hypothetical protein RHMOL_Rhmol02G0059300 [Rhododendron molle]|uniref:Uncharacterized protein n=2 Tax=Rhododendron molle TaxID=49168 RepID=A0ACC0PNK7_RHOML|nr:hypothetical protein RHMOL_Rhmol13G0033100 [Rhododendron molle]KAI8566664.1 hypothetical protein RHMOL_Rhmol02G0059300 [Rhododendron molle]
MEIAAANGVFFKWVRRSAKKEAHGVSSLAMKGKLPFNWVACSPSNLLSILNFDASL